MRYLDAGAAAGSAKTPRRQSKGYPSRMDVLLIGGTGYIGSAVFRHLTAAGLNVETADLELRGNRVNARNHKVNFQHLTSSFLSHYSTVILLAGHSNVRQSVEDPYGAFDNN